MMQLGHALITGAGSGIGKEVALKFAQQGWSCVLAGRTRAKLDTVCEVIRGAGLPEPAVHDADLSEPREIKRLAAQAKASWPKLNVVVNNAAVAEMAPFAATNDDVLERALAVNFVSPFILVRELWPTLVQQNRSVVINISSIAAHEPFAGFSAYGASKAALESLTRTLAVEGGAHNIKSYCIAPGAVETPMLRGLFSETVIPASQTIAPQAIAELVLGCVQGRHSTWSGKTMVVSDNAAAQALLRNAAE